MRRRAAYACAGGLLSVGAPMGLCAVRLGRRARRRTEMSLRGALREIGGNLPDYFYVGASTAVALALFGFVVGRQADQLADLSETDPLTGLTNARGLSDHLEAELARLRRYHGPLSLLLLDLDGLKGINDRYGHRAGDDAIRCLGEVIRSQLRESDLGARWGGDEFAVVAPNTSKDAALALAERIRSLLGEQDGQPPLTGSVGVATVDPTIDGGMVSRAALMRAADAALYEAKRLGRNRVISHHQW
jgi:two-component system, cell cycle response regulator